MFTSTASQGSGQETTIMTAVTQLAHHGMIYVPTGYGSGAGMFGLDAAKVRHVAGEDVVVVSDCQCGHKDETFATVVVPTGSRAGGCRAG